MIKYVGITVGLHTEEIKINVSNNENNAGSLILENNLPPQFTPRSKQYAAKTIWFRDEIVKRGIKLCKIDTVEKLGDIFTKVLTRVTLDYLWKKFMGW